MKIREKKIQVGSIVRLKINCNFFSKAGLCFVLKMGNVGKIITIHYLDHKGKRDWGYLDYFELIA